MRRFDKFINKKEVYKYKREDKMKMNKVKFLRIGPEQICIESLTLI